MILILKSIQSARIYFLKESSEEIVTGCVRKNGDTCEKTSSITQRYLGTEYGSEIAILPGALNIKNGSLSIDFEDETDITLTSQSGLSLNAGGEIAICIIIYVVRVATRWRII